ncbi:hypothetical protein IBX65_07405 [Candidatus Aerophobetes bacterium]|nr:hypothetical protein [Candidatus Aerophobetes bacterium]
MPKLELEVEIEQLAKILEGLSPGELETLEILLNPQLTDELKRRRQEAKIKFEQGETLSKEQLFSD